MSFTKPDPRGSPSIRDEGPSWLRWPSRKVMLLSTHALATLFSILSLTECSFMVENTADDNSYSGSSAVVVSKKEVGLFTRSVYDNTTGNKLGCVRYTNHGAFDSMFQAGRTFGTMTAMFACTSFFLAAIVLMFLPRTARWSKILWSTGRWLLMTATISQMFTFFAIGSDFLCSMGDCKLTGVGAFGIHCWLWACEPRQTAVYDSILTSLFVSIAHRSCRYSVGL